MESKKTQTEQARPVRRVIRTILIIFLLSFMAVLATFLLYYNWLLKTPPRGNIVKKIIEIKAEEGTFIIGENLMNMGLVRSDWAFYLETKIKNISLEPGIYELSSNMNIHETIKTISSGKTKMVKITIPEGYRTEQIAQVLSKNNLVAYEDFVSKAKKYEGKLFPDTYFFALNYSSDEIIQKMLDDYHARTQELSLTEKDLIIASIVEREAINDIERLLIAGIYENRLRIDMKLQADPTVQYGRDNIAIAKGNQSGFKFWKPITAKEYYSVASDYNTYKIDGLPPGPICNPGLASIEAVINFQENDYFYFLQANGNIYPAKTFKEHESNIEKYL